MNEPEVITVPNPKLTEPTAKVGSFANNQDLQNQITQMIKVLRQEGGIGLAANQLGYGNRVIVVEFKELEKNKEKTEIPLTIFINPEIVEYGKDWECLEEGCLSVPKIELEVDRPSQLKIKYQDVNGKKIKAAPKGLLARILQHEIDHLNGIVFTERIREQFFQKFPEFKNLKIAYFGSGDFAAIILECLILLGLNLEIYTEQSKPAGRDQELKPTPVAQVAKKFGKKFTEISNLSSPISDFDLLICADFGQKIPNQILNQAKIAALVIHPSLLPKYVGPTPVQTAILRGDKKTGVSIIKMIDKIDEGPIYSQIETEILPDETYPLLRDRLATLALKLLIKTLPKIVRDELELIQQDLTKIKKTRKFTKKDSQINWQQSPARIVAQVRAFYPWPGTYTFINDKRIIIHAAHLQDKLLVLDVVQSEGKRPIPFKEFLKGYKGPKPDWFTKISLV